MGLCGRESWRVEEAVRESVNVPEWWECGDNLWRRRLGTAQRVRAVNQGPTLQRMTFQRAGSRGECSCSPSGPASAPPLPGRRESCCRSTAIRPAIWAARRFHRGPPVVGPTAAPAAASKDTAVLRDWRAGMAARPLLAGEDADGRPADAGAGPADPHAHGLFSPTTCCLAGGSHPAGPAVRPALCCRHAPTHQYSAPRLDHRHGRRDFHAPRGPRD